MKLLIFILLLNYTIYCSENETPSVEDYSEENAKEFIKRYNNELSIVLNKYMLAYWAYYSNITNETRQNQLNANSNLSSFNDEQWKEGKKYHWQTFEDENLKRQFKKYSDFNSNDLPNAHRRVYFRIISEMQEHQSTLNICSYRNSSKCDLNLEIDVDAILKQSLDLEELKYTWLESHNKAGIASIKNRYIQYIELSKETARIKNYTDYSDTWLKEYESTDIKNQINNLWLQIKPLYQQLHAYIRYNLRRQYGDVIPEKGPIPDHLIFNIQAFQLPSNPQKNQVNITAEMIKQNYTALKMFKLAEEFFISIGLDPMPQSFWNNSVFEKPEDQEVNCVPASWDFWDSKDFRIHMCTVVNEENLYTVHHEMGHIEYFMQYKNQPIQFRDSANSGFHEAIGDTMALSVSTPKHLRQIGLLKSDNEDLDTSINHLYNVALNKILRLPYIYVVDLWRWGVFKGEITSENYNTEWWNLKKQYQGVEPPVIRTEDDFDPATIYHVVADTPYINYFLSTILQYQFHKALCEKANQYQPDDPKKQLHMCDIYNSTEAGQAFRNMLQLGSSKPWPDAIELLTGQRQMDAGPLVEYFRPLQNWLEEQNKINNVTIGWDM